MNYSLIYLYRFFGDLVPVIPLIGIYLTSNNLSLSEVSSLFLIFAIVVAFLEVPTGMISDRFNKKNILIFSRMLKLTCFIIWFLFPVYYGFLIGYLFWALASSFDSGTYQAYLYKILKKENKEEEFESVYGKSMTSQIVAMIFATTCIFWVPFTGYNFLIIIGIISLILSTCILFLLKKDEHVNALGTDNDKSAKLSFQTLRGLPIHLIIAILIGALVGGIKGTLDDYTTILFKDIYSSIATVGGFLIAIELIKSFGTFHAEKIKLSLLNQNWVMLLTGFCFFSIYLKNPILSIIFLIALIFIDAVLWVNNDTYIQKHASERNRATLHSFKSFFTEIFSFVSLGIFTYLGYQNDVSIYYLFGGITLTLFAIVFLLLVKLKIFKYT